jgi:preprotein translocase subunit SecA
MFEFIVQKPLARSAQRFIEKLNPKVSVHVPDEYPMSMLKALRKNSAIVSEVNGLEEKYEGHSDTQLRAKTKEFQEGYLLAVKSAKAKIEDITKELRNTKDYESKEAVLISLEEAEESLKKDKQKYLKNILPEAFAIVREAGKRVLNMRHYDVQILAGMVLNDGGIAEMTTGEGKTLVATLPSYLNALTGEGVHVVTVNDYLATRDAQWMGPLHEFLGFTVGIITHDLDPQKRHAAYRNDIVYGTNNEFGFDYLRDNMVNNKEDMAQARHQFAIVDEVDSILVDEARTPLIISGPAEQATDKYYTAFDASKKLKGRLITEQDEVEAKQKEIDLADGYDYLADEKTKIITLSESGEEKAAELFGVENLHDMATIEIRHHILAALRAKEFFKRDVDYVVNDGEVIIVDEFTGRMMPGRRWSDGLHQAVEAREGIKIARENQTLATITFQNYFRMYEKLSGMTGTAMTEATEFKQIYDLDCVVMPTNRVLQRKNYADAVYRNVREKYEAVADEVKECNKIGQPVLIGTISIEKSEALSALLTQRGVTHKVLNAKFHEQEANIIAQAGRFGAVTIATNMAGRGTDIVLGGNAEALAHEEALGKAKNNNDTKEVEALTKELLGKYEAQVKGEQAKVIEAGGLFVMGTERHESRRIDNQLRGRQGRQGDPGSSRFFVSLEDDLMRLFASDKIVTIMDKLGMEKGQALEHPWLSSAIETAQKRVEGHNFEIRKHLLEYDDVMNRQREVLYELRREVLESDDVKDLILDGIDQTVRGMTKQFLGTVDDDQQWDQDGLRTYLKDKFGFRVAQSKEDLAKMESEAVVEEVTEEILKLYERKEQSMDSEPLRYLERMLMMHTIDTKWKDHLYGMDQLKDSVGLRSYGQRDPIVEYKREGFHMFQSMYDSINQEVSEVIYKVEPIGTQDRARPAQGVFDAVPQQMVHADASAMEQRSQASSEMAQAASASRQQVSKPVVNQGPKVGRNDDCPCGSGKKYKKCCG